MKLRSNGQIDVRLGRVRRFCWSRVRAVTQPRLELELRLVLELLRALPDASTRLRVTVLPTNILVATDGRVMVGAVRPEDTDEYRRYLAPESGEDSSFGIAPVVYSIGVLLFEAVTGYTFESPQSVERELMGCRSMARAAGLGEEFWELRLLEAAARATREDPEQRWPTAGDFAQAIESAAGRHLKPRNELADLVFEAAAEIGPSEPNTSRINAETAAANAKAFSPPAGDNDTGVISSTENPCLLDAMRPAGIDPVEGVGAGGTRRTLLGVGTAVPRPRPTAKSEDEAPETSTGGRKQTPLGLGLAAAPNAAPYAPAATPVASPMSGGAPPDDGSVPALAQHFDSEAPTLTRVANPTSGGAPPDDGSVPALAQHFDSEAPTLTRYPGKKRRVGRVLLGVVATGLLILLPVKYGGYLTSTWQSLAPSHAAPPAAAAPLEPNAPQGSEEAASDSAESGDFAKGEASAVPPALADSSELVVVPCTECESDASTSAGQDAGVEKDAEAAVREQKTAPKPKRRPHEYKPPVRDYGI